MLVELSLTDKAMAYSVKHNRVDIYDEYFNIHLAIISDWVNYKPLSDKQYASLTIY